MSAIDDKYVALGGVTGWLGAPTSQEMGTPDGKGRFRHYQNGSIYWSPTTGAHEVHGSIRRRWEALGWEKSFIGYPLTDEMTTPDGIGRYNHFQGGSIYWSPATAAYEVCTAAALRSHRMPLWGVADLHAHPASHLAFGADAEGNDGILWGKSGVRLEDAGRTIATDLPACAPDKHSGTNLDFIRHETRKTIISSINQLTGHTHTAAGWPNFDGWPHALSVLHQQMHIAWIHRAWQGGLRLLFASVTDNQTLAMLWQRGFDVSAGQPRPHPNNEFASAKRQLTFIRNLAGANATWMEVVETPVQARTVIASGKLAVILSLEMDSLTAEQMIQLRVYGRMDSAPIASAPCAAPWRKEWRA